MVAAIFLARPWLRQKIIWQKGIDTLSVSSSRCGARTSGSKDVDVLQGHRCRRASRTPNHVRSWLAAPLDRAWASMAAVNGTEFAFKQHKVRYLVSIAARVLRARGWSLSGRDQGRRPFPIGRGASLRSSSSAALVGSLPPPTRTEQNIARFTAMLQRDLASVAGVLKKCDTVWVLGDFCPPPPRGQLSAFLLISQRLSLTIAKARGSLGCRTRFATARCKFRKDIFGHGANATPAQRRCEACIASARVSISILLRTKTDTRRLLFWPDETQLPRAVLWIFDLIW